MKKYFTLLVLALVTLVSCDKDETKETSPKEYDVYITGPIRDVTGDGAAYWKNGVKVNLPTTTGSYGLPNDIVVSNGDVYVAGYEGTNDKLSAVYWKNGKKETLSAANTTTLETYATAICVVGEDIYIAGGRTTSNGEQEEDHPVYWKNGKMVELTGGASWAISIRIEGNDVYVLDKEGYWKNGKRVQIPFSIDPEKCFATDMQIVGNDVYVAGYETNSEVSKAMYWKNGVAVSLSKENAYATSIFVSEGNVYVAGVDKYKVSSLGLSYVTYWKNGVPVYLSDNTEDNYAESIIVLDNNIFVSGTSQNGWGYWINEKFHLINEKIILLTSMFVVERK